MNQIYCEWQLVLNKDYKVATLLPVHNKEEFRALPERRITHSVEKLKSFGVCTSRVETQS